MGSSIMFKVGDRVRTKSSRGPWKKGATGTVCAICERFRVNFNKTVRLVGIEFDEYIGGHDLVNNVANLTPESRPAKYGHGWWLGAKDELSEIKHERKWFRYEL